MFALLFVPGLSAGRRRPVDLRDFALVLTHERFISLVRHDRQKIDFVSLGTVFGVVDALTVLVDRDAKSAADLLPLLDLAVALVERRDVEHIGVVPSHAQGGMREDELNRIPEAQEFFLLFQDEVEKLPVRAHGMLVVCVFALSRLCEIVALHGGYFFLGR